MTPRHSRQFWRASLMMCSIVSSAVAQQPAAPSAESSDQSSLEVTLKFVQDRLNAVGAVNFVAHTHDATTGDSGTNRFREEISRVSADPSACLVNFHQSEARDGQVLADFDAALRLRQIRTVVVVPGEQFIKEGNIKHGHASISTSIDPQAVVLKTIKADETYNNMWFADQELAKRVAQAMTHAVELCSRS